MSGLLRSRRVRGVTLVELMIAIAVMAVLLMLAVPSFQDFRMRSIVRGGGDQLVSFWANARMEALKRDQDVTITLVQVGDGMCIGADTAAAGCNCNTGSCNVAKFPNDQREWKGAKFSNITLGEGGGSARINAKRGALTDPDDFGGIDIAPPSSPDYRLRFVVDTWGRPFLCERSGGIPLPDYSNKRCAE